MAVESLAANLAPQITGAIRQAAQSTGVSFEYLLATAKIESNFNPAAQASTSSAKGLYQFIEQTWLGTVKQDGPGLGLGRYADAITQSADGRYDVSDPNARAAIMKLRGDPEASALMAGAFTRNNAAQLQSAIGRAPTEGELYAAHFLGPDGAGKLINAAMTNTRANAAAMFPKAAAANPTIFYNRDGSAKTAGQVYARLTGRFDNSRTVTVASATRAVPVAPATRTVPVPVPVASATQAVEKSAAPATKSTAATAATAAAALAPPDTAGVTQAFAAAHDRLPPLPDTKPLFQAMFTDRAHAAVTKTVSGLWAPSAAQAANKTVRPLDLFTDSPTDTRKLFTGKA